MSSRKVNTLTGWLKAKKTPQEIARDKKRATEQKMRRNQQNKKFSRKQLQSARVGSGGNGKKMIGRGKKKKPSYKDDSDEDFEEDEDDDFIVDDDEDELEIEESEDEVFDSELEDEDDEEDIVLDDDDDSEDGIEAENHAEVNAVTLSSRSSRAAARTTTKSRNLPSVVDSNSEDSDDDGDSFLPTDVSLRRSAPSKLLQKNASAAKRRFNPGLSTTLAGLAAKKQKQPSGSSLMQLQKPALKKPPLKKLKQPKTLMQPKSSILAKRKQLDDEEELTSPLYTPNRGSNGKVKSNPEMRYEEIFSSDEENTVNFSTSNNTKPKRPLAGEKSRYFERQPVDPKLRQRKTIVLDDSDSDISDDGRTTKTQFKHSTKNEPDNALADTPDPGDQDRRRRLNTKQVRKIGSNVNDVSSKKVTRVIYSIGDSSDEDEKAQFGDTNVHDDDDDFDEDTRVAMKLSLMDSKKRGAKDTKTKKKKTGEEKKDDSNNIEMILDDSSDEEDGDQGEEYYDEEKETATNILRSAEQLSSHVVRAMNGWFGNDDNNNGGAIQGIIVDGAVSLGNIDESSKSRPDGNDDDDEPSGNTHKWISKAVMAKAIPNVTLSGYQLIGVNWMALLNGMTCEVGSNGTKNVNGVLADEMGLVCIIFNCCIQIHTYRADRI